MTSKLEKYLSKELYTRFGNLSICQNYRPAWMEGLELDFYIDELKIAAEVQGEQHYSFVKFFHKSKDDLEKQQIRDAKKQIICRERKIALIEIFTEKDADLFVLKIKELIKPKNEYNPKYFYIEDDLSKMTPRQKRKFEAKQKQEKQQLVSKLRKQYQQEWNGQ